MNNKQTSPKVWVGCLAAYNSGDLHGEWIDATDDAEDIDAAIRSMLTRSPVPFAEEADIFDTDEFCGHTPKSCTGEAIAELGTFIEEYGEVGGVVLSHFGGDLEEATEALTERAAGEYKSLEDFAAEQIESCFEIPKGLEGYIDHAAYGRDLRLGGDIIVFELGHERVAVFWSR